MLDAHRAGLGTTSLATLPNGMAKQLCGTKTQELAANPDHAY
jgi:hypothetical protein